MTVKELVHILQYVPQDSHIVFVLDPPPNVNGIEHTSRVRKIEQVRILQVLPSTPQEAINVITN